VITPRKEVIQPLLPERLPCYDLVLIADLTLLRRTSEFGCYRLCSLDGRCSEILSNVTIEGSPATGHAVFPHPGGPAYLPNGRLSFINFLISSIFLIPSSVK